MFDNPKLHRRIEGEFFISADSWDEFLSVISDIQNEARQTKEANENLYWVSSGDNSGASLNIVVDPFMTRDQYLTDLQDMTARKVRHHA